MLTTETRQEISCEDFLKQHHYPPTCLFNLERHKREQAAAFAAKWDELVAANPLLAQIKRGAFFTDAVLVRDDAFARQVRDDYIFAQTGR